MVPIDQFFNDRTKPHRHFKQNGCKPCFRKYNNEWDKANPLKKILIRAKQALKRRVNVPKEFDIDEEYLKLFDTDTCPILGIPMQWNIGKNIGQGAQGGIHPSPGSKSLDRIRSTQGYLKGNVHIISWRANKLKGDATLEELVLIGEWAKQKIYETTN